MNFMRLRYSVSITFTFVQIKNMTCPIGSFSCPIRKIGWESPRPKNTDAGHGFVVVFAVVDGKRCAVLGVENFGHSMGLANLFGGHRNAGEKHRDCALREFTEESGTSLQTNEAIFCGWMTTNSEISHGLYATIAGSAAEGAITGDGEKSVTSIIELSEIFGLVQSEMLKQGDTGYFSAKNVFGGHANVTAFAVKAVKLAAKAVAF